jgi:hypothetical protein
MKKNKVTLLILLVFGGAFLVDQAVKAKFAHFRAKPSLEQAQSKMVLPIDEMVESAKVDNGDLQSVVESELPKINQDIPSDAEVFAEVRDNPHNVPSSMLDFTVLVSEKMKQAKKSYLYADALFSEFGICAAQDADDKQNLALRAYCLANAKRLVSWYPGLMGRWRQLSDQVGQSLLELVDMS